MPNYFITFHTYGTWLHGNPRGSVDPRHNTPGTPVIPRSRKLIERDADRSAPPVLLDALRRGVTHATIEHICAFKGWKLHELNVRTNHVHLVVTGRESPEKIMNAAKSWSTRIMVASGVFPAGVDAWARHGSTPWLNTDNEFNGAVKYVRDDQGPALPRELPPAFDIERLIRESSRTKSEDGVRSAHGRTDNAP